MEILKSNLFLFLCLFVVCSCNDKVSERPFVIDNENTTHIEQSEFDEMFKSVSVIPLETTEECVVVNIKKSMRYPETSIYSQNPRPDRRPCTGSIVRDVF